MSEDVDIILADGEVCLQAKRARKIARYLKPWKYSEPVTGIGITLSFHLARHSFADLLRRNEWSVYDISKLLGHARIATTERYLASFDREHLNEKIGDLF